MFLKESPFWVYPLGLSFARAPKTKNVHNVLESKFRVLSWGLTPRVLTFDSLGSVCKVRTQDPENFDEEVKSLVTALSWCT